MVLAGLALCFSLSQSNAQTTSGAAPSVVVAEVLGRDVTRGFDYVDRVEAIDRVSLRATCTGDSRRTLVKRRHVGGARKAPVRHRESAVSNRRTQPPARVSSAPGVRVLAQ